jgi:hypothetical protein
MRKSRMTLQRWMFVIALVALICTGAAVGKPFYSVLFGVTFLLLFGAPLLGVSAEEGQHSEVPKKCLACGGSSFRSGRFIGPAQKFFPYGYRPPGVFSLDRSLPIRAAVCLDCGQLVSSLDHEQLRKLQGNETASVGAGKPSTVPPRVTSDE